jgi:chromosome segregation ATPase
VLLAVWLPVQAQENLPTMGKVSRLQELGFENMKELPRLDKRDFGRCLSTNFSLLAEYQQLQKQRDGLDAESKEIGEGSRKLGEANRLLLQEQDELSREISGLQAKSADLSQRRATIEKKRPNNPLPPAEAKRFNVEVESFNSDIKRVEKQRLALAGVLPDFNARLERYNLNVGHLNERISLYRASVERFEISLKKTNDTIQFHEANCAGKRVIELQE